ncbi:MAG TPA: hypothetical protein VFR10_15145 [bacterium]|nr:hypothetical protein [bacterium]
MPRILVILAAIHVAAFVWIAHLKNPILFFPAYAAGVLAPTIGWLVLAIGMLRGNLVLSRRALVVGWAVAIAARMVLLFPSVPLSTDLYRYLWDGRVASAGINPYVHAPSSPNVAQLRDSNWPYIEHADHWTVYPPLAQEFFRLMHWAGTTPRGVRAWAIALDLGAAAIFAAVFPRRGKSAALALVYAWCPLAILESALGGHVDSLGILFLALACLFADRLPARAREFPSGIGSGLFLSASAMVKLIPFALVPAFATRRSMKWLVLFALGAGLPLLLFRVYRDPHSHLLDGLATYARYWYFNDLAYTPLVQAGIDPLAARRILALLFMVAALAISWRTRDLLAANGLVLFTYLALSPTVHPWYGMWIAAFVASIPPLVRPAAMTLVALLPFSYVTPWWQARTGIAQEPGWNRLLLWIPVLTVLIWTMGKRALRGRS